MILRLLRALKRNGLAGTANIFLQRTHPARHIAVPVEMARRPRHIIPWFRDRLSGTSPSIMGMPWISMACIDFLDRHVRPGMRVLEWGGGGSTVYFLRRGCLLTTVESSDVWVKEISSRVDALPGDCKSRWDLRFVPSKSNNDPLISKYIDQVNQGGPWDIVLVDGWSRFRCFMEAKNRMRVNGILVLDNADQDQYAHVPGQMSGWRRHAFRGLGVARSWVTQTDAYVRLT